MPRKARSQTGGEGSKEPEKGKKPLKGALKVARKDSKGVSPDPGVRSPSFVDLGSEKGDEFGDDHSIRREEMDGSVQNLHTEECDA